ncbi:ABC transporter ATP-binding protein [Ornithinimicrobium sediminis]|uniref:ABC transporter ATP-binding protein n=1 Tax=Ornithinimicrobium sediminis TaxID=2904603 RepID=UPI001E61EA5C|nr:ABC transporter ATP-binding protein [Ornithinimicrobium sediminis]
MTAVEIVQVGKSYGDVVALDSVDLTLDTGEFVAVLGPSGCGKTTLLRCIAGFERIDHGRITLGGRVVTLPGVHMPPHRRHVTVVPQDGALFPHLSVADNVGYGLGRGRGKTARVEECLELVGLGGLGARMPHELSGGQQQRVAVARALAPHPPLVLLDEPFSALDASLRTGLREDVRRALAEDGATALLVTHDQGEALSMAHRVAVMRDGRIHQFDTPAEVYRHPVDSWVAQFVGEAMLLPLEGPAGHAERMSRLGVVRLRPDLVDLAGGPTALVRPEQVRIVRAGTLAPGHAVPGRVAQIAYHGHDALITVDVPGSQTAMVRVIDDPVTAVEPGDDVRLWVEGDCTAYPAEAVAAESGATPLPVVG